MATYRNKGEENTGEIGKNKWPRTAAPEVRGAGENGRIFWAVQPRK
jgi:hypothetical protein